MPAGQGLLDVAPSPDPPSSLNLRFPPKGAESFLQDIKSKLLSHGRPAQQQIVIISYDLVQKMHDYASQ